MNHWKKKRWNMQCCVLSVLYVAHTSIIEAKFVQEAINIKAEEKEGAKKIVTSQKS